ncbi:MAG: hypothetical protein HPY79_11155 [Bacteroidales bacterium]|nr:hypothetical protein [Bacteroidales bacterium]
MKKLFLLLLSGGIMMTACKKEDVKKEETHQLKRLEIKNPNFILINENYISGGCVGELYVNYNNIADTLYIIKKIIENSNKSETTWEGTFGVTVTPISNNQNQVDFTCDGEPSTCRGTCSFDSKGNIIGCRINVLK